MATNILHWESMYEKPLQEIPWEISEPPKELIEVIENREVKLCKVLDFGCGTGNYSIYLAKLGFSVTGIDCSKNALSIAKKNAKNSGVKIKFVLCDILEICETVKEKFDFVLDYSLLHHLPLEQTKNHAESSCKLLNKNGKVLLVCYSEKDEDAKEKNSNVGKYGNLMYYRTANEIRAAYSRAGFKELYYKEVRLGKRLHHAAYCFMFQKI